MVAASPFVDFYALLGADPDTPQDELKKVYFEKLREFHPDKRPQSAGGTGQRVTQELNKAWETLSKAEARKAYDDQWRKEKEAALPPHQRADLYRRKGNALYVEGRDLQKGNEGKMDFSVTREAMNKFMSAIEQYGKAIEIAPYDHRFFSNRALCFAALDDWRKCKEDAMNCAKLRPDFMKGWFLLAKALWKLGSAEDAVRELESGLKAIPGSKELLELRQEIGGSNGGSPVNFAASLGRSSSRSVSPAATPPQQHTPPTSARSQGPAHNATMGNVPGVPMGATTPPQSFRNLGATTPPPASGAPGGGCPSPPRKSPSLAAAAAASARLADTFGRSASKSPAPSQPGSRKCSKSPGPAPWSKQRLDCNFDSTGQYGVSGGFGVPTPCFAGPGGIDLGQSVGSQLHGNTMHSFAGTRGATPPRR